MTSPQQSARQRGQSAPQVEPDAAAAGVREWLAAVPATDGSRRAAAFDTRLDKPLSGGAAPRIARQLRWWATKSLPTLKTSSTRTWPGQCAPVSSTGRRRGAPASSPDGRTPVRIGRPVARRRRDLERNPMGKVGAISGLVALALGVGGASFERGAPGVGASAQEVAEFFQTYRTELLTQSLLMLLSAGALLWFPRKPAQSPAARGGRQRPPHRRRVRRRRARVRPAGRHPGAAKVLAMASDGTADPQLP